MPERRFPEMEGMSEEEQERYLREVERQERRILRAVSPMLLEVHKAADGNGRARLISAVEQFLFSLGPLLEAYLPEARENLAEDIEREGKPPLGKPGEVVKVRLDDLRPAPWARWIDAVFPDESSEE